MDGWEAPALTALSNAPVPWSANELYRYLPDDDIRAMATYLASFQSKKGVLKKKVWPRLI